ncbi:uncharacterized protein LOC127104483 [Lathyrus oleraceus]|uniref:uncharacterized protein LOC127104483 n=1 Tax=Pisum sativum TaxID=3888 RepID=UPI0021D1A6A6|nr:uncharacterized protein LOC127104483 [Pisum sativum]
MTVINDHAIVDALEATAHVMGQANQAVHNYNRMADKLIGIVKFKRNNPPTFKGRYDPKGTDITWGNFKTEFLEKYFSADVRSKKKIEFFELKQVNMIIVDYVVKFEELFRFFPYYIGVEDEGSKCIKFDSGLCLEMKQFIKYQEIRQFSVLVNKCKTFSEDSCAISAHYKSISKKKMEVKPFENLMGL